MAAVPPRPPPPNWTAKDDLLLKNAVEAGLCLEWIADGRVKFSQTYTLEQITVRWYSLLYDPVISAKASARMVELERSLQLGKRKPESVRQQYYTTRRKLLKEQRQGTDISSRVECGTSNLSDMNENLSQLPKMASVEDDIFADLTTSCPYDLVDEEAQLFMDTYVNNPIDNSHNDSFGSFLFDSPNNDELPDVGPEELYPSPTLDAPRRPGRAVYALGPEYRNGTISCQLNIQDTDIPSNEDVFIPFRIPGLFNSSRPRGRSVDPYYLLARTFENIPTYRKVSQPSGKIRSSQQSGASGNIQIGGYGMKPKFPSSETSEDRIFRSLLKDCLDNLVPRIVKESPTNMVHGTRNLNVTSAGPSSVACPDSFRTSLRSLNTSKKDEAGTSKAPPVSDSKDKSYFEDDDSDVPCFSDIEAMIVEMDKNELLMLSRDEDYRPQYEDDEIKRIIRLEQSANSHMHRALAAAGAFAVLSGRYSKHFIKKTEVLIGRASDEHEVDIDLGRERSGGSISRRQAIIKMDMNGLFILTNIGKCPLIVNGNEVATRMSIVLRDGCLIEIRKVAFLFETNPVQIKRHVDSKKASCSSDQKTSGGH